MTLWRAQNDDHKINFVTITKRIFAVQTDRRRTSVYSFCNHATSYIRVSLVFVRRLRPLTWSWHGCSGIAWIDRSTPVYNVYQYISITSCLSTRTEFVARGNHAAAFRCREILLVTKTANGREPTFIQFAITRSLSYSWFARIGINVMFYHYRYSDAHAMQRRIGLHAWRALVIVIIKFL